MMNAASHLFLAVSIGQGSPSPPPPLHGLISGLDKDNVELDVMPSGLDGYAGYSINGKYVEVQWVYPVAGLTDGSLAIGPDMGTSLDHYQVSFWPTEVVALDSSRLLVAGATARGKTLIEVFTFSSPATLPSVSYPVGGGPRVVPSLHVPLASRQTVYETDTGSGRYVSAMFRNRAKQDSVFVRFDDTKEIFDLDISTGSLVKVATTPESGDTSVMAVPNLERRYSSINDGEHVSLGHLYWFSAGDARTGTPILMLVDADKDGALDGNQLITTWDDTYADPKNFVDSR